MSVARSMTPRMPYPAADTDKGLRACHPLAVTTTASSEISVAPAARQGGNRVLNIQAIGTRVAVAGGGEGMGAPVFDNDLVIGDGDTRSFDLTGEQLFFRVIGEGTGRIRWWLG